MTNAEKIKDLHARCQERIEFIRNSIGKSNVLLDSELDILRLLVADLANSVLILSNEYSK